MTTPAESGPAPPRHRRAGLVAAITTRLPVRRIQAAHWLGRVLGRPRGPFVGRFRGGWLEVHPGEWASLGAFYAGWYEREVTAWVLAELRGMSGGVVLDVGANFGYYPLLIGSAAGPRVEVVAFEPDPTNFAWLCRNLTLNPCVRCTPVPVAVSGSSGGWVPFASAEPGRSLWAQIAPPESTGRTISVPTIALDDFARERGLGTVPLTLIDVEGNEGRVLDGMKEGLAAGRYRKVMVELHPRAFASARAAEDVFRPAVEVGYHIYRMPHYRPPDADRRRRYYSITPADYTPGPASFENLTEWEHFLLVAPDRRSDEP